MVVPVTETRVDRAVGPDSQSDDLIKILLVDDQPSNLTALEVMLASTGCRLVRAQTPDEALLALLDDDFAAVVLDVKMPGMSGFELARLIKDRRRTRHLPILFLTAYLLDDDDVVRGYQAGAVDYLTKPINPLILQSKIAVFADLYRNRRALADTNRSLEREMAEREAAQAALRQANQELEVRVLERTEALSIAHDAVRENDERLRLAMDSARMGWWMWDLVGDRIAWSPNPRHPVDAPPEDFGGSIGELMEMIHPDDRARVDQEVNRSLRTSGEFRCEVRFLRPEGAVRWALATGKVTFDPSGRPVRMTGVDLDITTRKEAEEALREADRKKDEFLAMLAHELRNPLAPVGYALEVLQLKGPVTPELQWAHGVIFRQLRQMTRLVDDLLDVSRISRGTLEVRREPVQVDAIVRDAIETSRPIIEASGSELSVTLPADPISVSGDPVRLAQCLMNLLTNAAKYSPRGGRIALVATRQGGTVEISVKDDGIGIPREMLGRIFEIFTQVDRSLERSRGGLGVGLALVDKIVAMHGGTVEARSDGVGRGSEFVVRLPVLETITVPVLAPKESGISVNGVKQRILVAEDGRDAADSFGTLLSILGYEVRIAYDGQEAIEAAEAFRPGVVIMDIGMPKLNGYDAARHIRAQPWGKDIFLVALTGWGQSEDRRRSREAGFDRHFTKPVDPAALESLLESLSHDAVEE